MENLYNKTEKERLQSKIQVFQDTVLSRYEYQDPISLGLNPILSNQDLLSYIDDNSHYIKNLLEFDV